MTREILKHRLSALEEAMSQADAETRQEVVERLSRLVTSLDAGLAEQRYARHRMKARLEEADEDVFDNMPV